MQVLSLFDGISCGQIALNRAGIKYKLYYASEIDKYAIKVAQANFPSTFQLGDINHWRQWPVAWEKIGLILAGSPCQGFSFAGKQLAFDDPRSKLFFVFADILRHIQSYNPEVKFLLENVVMKKESQKVISDTVKAEAVLINSALVSAQNRNRLYWCNWQIAQPEDKGIMLQDIIETGSGVIKNKGVLQLRNEKAMCLDANYHKGADNHGQRTLIIQKPRGKNSGGIKAEDGKTPCMSANAWQENNHLLTGQTYRKLTPLECERLQTVPCEYTAHVSNTRRTSATLSAIEC